MTDNENDNEKKDWDFKVDVEEPKKVAMKEVETKEKRIYLDENARRILKAQLNEKPRYTIVNEDKERAASMIKRAIAQVIDLFIMFLLFILSSFLVPVFMNITTNKKVTALLSNPQVVHKYIFLFSAFLIFVVFVATYNASIGKMIMGIKIVSKEADAIYFIQTFKREVLFKPLSIISVVGIGYAFFNVQKKTLHDIFAHTLVIKKK
jgi:uncharacterized RDD family membrane protein YckC